MKRKNKILTGLLAIGMLFSLATANSVYADETKKENNEIEITDSNQENDFVSDDEVVKVEETNEILTDESDNITATQSMVTPMALSEPAFPATSQALHDEILTRYGSIDTSRDGIISQDEARNYVGVIRVMDIDLGGTINGIEYFTGATDIRLRNCNFVGAIPENIGNLNVTTLILDNNNFTGEIPASLWTMDTVTQLYLSYNQLEGELPTTMDGLKAITRFYIQSNNLSGELPASINNMTTMLYFNASENNFTGPLPEIDKLTSMNSFSVSNNSLSGEIPNSYYNLPSLERFRVDYNSEISGDITTGFAGSNSIKYIDVRGTKTSQVKPETNTNPYAFLHDILNINKDDVNEGVDAQVIQDLKDSVDIAQALYPNGGDYDAMRQLIAEEEAIANELFAVNPIVDALFNADKTDLNNGVTQEDINDTKNVVEAMSDGPAKERLLEEVGIAQNMLTAKDKVNALFTDNTHINIKDSVNQTVIDDAQSIVDKLPAGVLKDSLQREVTNAQNMLNAKNEVENLFTDGTHTDIKNSVDQTIIDNAQSTVDKLASGDLKDELQKEVTNAQNMLDAKNKVEDLFTDSTHTDIKDSVNQITIDDAQKAVNKLPDGTLKEELQKEINKAQDVLNAKNATNDLLDKDGNLNSGVTQDDIDNAQDLVNKLPNGDLKDQLQDIINNAQKQLDDKNKDIPVVTKPSVTPPVQTPSIDGGSTSSTSNVKTADTTNVSLYLGLVAISLGGIVLVKRRKIESK